LELASKGSPAKQSQIESTSHNFTIIFTRMSWFTLEFYVVVCSILLVAFCDVFRTFKI
jgi:hypothetical protein